MSDPRKPTARERVLSRPLPPPSKPLPSVKEAVENAPTGVSPFVQLMQSRERPHRVVTLPGFQDDDASAKVAIVALFDHELLDARLSALQWLTDVKKMPEWLLETELGQSILDNEIQSQCLFRALKQTRMITAPLCRSVAEVRMYMEPDVRLALWNEYVAFQHARSPLRSIRSPEELQELVSSLGKVSDARRMDSLSYLDSATLRCIIIELADQYVKQMKQQFLHTTQPNDSEQP